MSKVGLNRPVTRATSIGGVARPVGSSSEAQGSALAQANSAHGIWLKKRGHLTSCVTRQSQLVVTAPNTGDEQAAVDLFCVAIRHARDVVANLPLLRSRT